MTENRLTETVFQVTDGVTVAPVCLDLYGNFTAMHLEADGSETWETSNTLDGLKATFAKLEDKNKAAEKKAIKGVTVTALQHDPNATSRADRERLFPVTGVLLGKANGQDRVLQRGFKQHISGYETVYRPFTPEDFDEFARLQQAVEDAQKAYRVFMKDRALGNARDVALIAR